MNWKLVTTLIVGAVLVSACGASQQEPASPSGNRGPQEDPAPAAVEGGGAAAPSPSPGMQPAAKDPAGAKKDVVVHD
jgi:hypothetical protein